MKKTFLIITLCVSSFFFSQHAEISVGVNSGLFSFKGISAVNHSSINASDFSNAYTNNPYGTKSDLALGISLDYKYVLKNNLLWGANVGYENLRSKVNINQVIVNTLAFPATIVIGESAAGKTNLIYNNINFFPYLGYRMAVEKFNFDISAGADLAFILSAKDKGSATTANNITYETSLDRKTISTDFRPRIQLNAQYKKYGLHVGYSFGTVNYMKDYIGLGDYEAKSRMLRFGLTYQLK